MAVMNTDPQPDESRERILPGWEAHRTDPTTMHVVPVDDAQPHWLNQWCLCNPVTDDGDGGRIFAHQAYDQRELEEAPDAQQ